VTVHTTVFAPNVNALVSEWVTPGAVSILSVTVAVPRSLSDTDVVIPVASIVLSVGAVIVGFSVSAETVTVCVSVLVLPVASVAVHVMVCVPTANGPVGLALLVGALSTKSLTTGVPNVTEV
jgi:hypothetical protein